MKKKFSVKKIRINEYSIEQKKSCFISNSGISFVFAFGVVIVFHRFPHAFGDWFKKKDFQKQFFNL